MTKASISLQELRRKIYTKAKTDKHGRFWGLYCHICKKEVLREAYRMAKANDGAPGIDGKDFEDIKKLVTCLGMEGIINLPGALSHKEIIELYKTADIFVLPSLSEGIPIVIMEAMAMELPVVSTRIAGIPEIVDDRVNGFLVNPKDPEALAKKIEYLIHHPYLREDMGKKGRKIIEEKFDLDKNIRILEGWFKGQIFSPEAGVKNL